MSLLGPLLRSTPFDNPQVPMTSANVAYFLDLFGGGRTDSNEIVTPLTSMQLATAFGCVRLLADQVGICPQWVYARDISGAGKQLARNHYLFDVLSVSWNPEISAVVGKQSVVAQVLLWGNAYIEIGRDGAGRPIALWPRGAWKTRPIRREGQLAYETTDNAEGQLRIIEPENMIHIPYVSLDGQLGLSPVALVRQTFGAGLAMDRFAARFFGNYAKPAIAIRYPGLLNPVDKTQARTDWEALQSGSNQHRVAILDGGADIKELTMPLDDAQFLESRGFTDQRICGIYGVPPHMLGFPEKSNRATAEQQSIELVQYTLAPILGRFEQEMHRKLLPSTGRTAGRYFIAFDTREMRLPDASSRQAFYQSGIQNGYLLQDEVRAWEGLNPYPGDLGSQPVIQLNMQPLSSLTASAQPPSAKPAAEIEQNSLLDRLGSAYSPLFRDGFSRFLHRQKQDFAALHACVGPAIEALSVTLRGPLAAAPASGAALRQLLQAWLQEAPAWRADSLDGVVAALLPSALHLLAAAAAADRAAVLSAAPAAGPTLPPSGDAPGSGDSDSEENFDD